MAKLKDLASVVRSKNAGAFEITFDIMFEDKEIYDKVKQAGVIGRELFARLYHTPVEQVLFAEYDAACAFKGTIPRRIPSGDIGDVDVYGSQQHIPLLDIDIPIEVVAAAGIRESIQ